MSSEPINSVDAARGASRLITDAIEQLVRIVEAMHANISAAPAPIGPGTNGKAGGIAGFVYQTIRLVNSGVRSGVDAGLALAAERVATQLPSAQWDAVLSALNGVLGDYLEQTANPLALRMRFRLAGQDLPADLGQLPDPNPERPGRVLIAIHGLCMSDQQFTRKGHNHIEALAAEFGYTPLYLRYNSGRHISQNGRELAGQLEQLLQAWPQPVEEFLLVCHSMGGLLLRSALHYAAEAKLGWPAKLGKVIFLGTPHHGAPLERGGNWLESSLGHSPYTAPIARLGMLRSAGVTDLRHGNLLDQDWQGRDRFEPGSDPRSPLPLPGGIQFYAAAASTGARENDTSDRLLGDGLVPVASAFGRHPEADRQLALPAERQWLGYRLNHLDLLSDATLFQQLRAWVAAPQA